ncbi:MAG: DUF362 domain-containing protein, partial [Candidatus Eisenbacteria bacterium]|nr:DUF362 domain-containing protein [Candidatus Eisenbacteria bacterium]
DHIMPGARRSFERTGTAEAVSRFKFAKLVSLDEERVYSAADFPRGRALRKAQIPVALQKAGVFINLPSAKSHNATGVSLGMKNLMGLVWDRHAFHRDLDLHQGIADLATLLRPQLIVLDAIYLLKTGGPAGPGDVDEHGGVVAGVDPVAVDAYGATLTNWNGRMLQPDQVAYIRHAEEHGLGTTDLDSLDILELSC